MVSQPCCGGADRPSARSHEAKVSGAHRRYFQSSTRLSSEATYRTKEEVLIDLAKALQFSPEALESNRKGKLDGTQFTGLIGKCIAPFFLMILFAAAPFVIWGALTATKQH